MARDFQAPDHLGVMGGEKQAAERARRFHKAAGLISGIATIGVADGLLNMRARGVENGELLAGRGGAVITHAKQAGQLMPLSQRMESLSNQELIGKMLREGEEPAFQRGLEHNMATLILETRKGRAVADMAGALGNDPSPIPLGAGLFLGEDGIPERLAGAGGCRG
jgi:hypothetical protein